MYFKQLFKTPSALQLAMRELEESKRELLAMHASAEHAQKMVEYYEGAINRLTQYVKTESQSS